MTIIIIIIIIIMIIIRLSYHDYHCDYYDYYDYYGSRAWSRGALSPSGAGREPGGWESRRAAQRISRILATALSKEYEAIVGTSWFVGGGQP